MSRRLLLAAGIAAILLTAAAGAAFAQDHVPQPYDPTEFPKWAKEAFRFDAILVGSFPFTLFFTLETYDSWRYVSNGFSPGYAPWPFGSGTTISYSADETVWIAASAVSLSAVIAGIDFLIGKVNERSSRP